MHIRRSIKGLLSLSLLVCGLAGCAQTNGFRPLANANNSNNDVRTVASVGDKPLPVRSGESGSSPRDVNDDSGSPAPLSGTRITGRVYDENNQPVANARVRPSVDQAPGGRAIFATTDRSGAFTLNGLRRGAAYTLIAEYQDQDGFLSGRQETRAPETNVQISLRPRGTDPQARKTSIRPARSRSEPQIPSGNYDDEESTAPAPATSRRSRSSVLADPDDEETVSLPVGTRQLASSDEDDPPTVRAGYTGNRQSPTTTRAKRSVARPTQPEDEADVELPRSRKVAKAKVAQQPEPDEEEPAATRSRPKRQTQPTPDDDGENPLPPAIEPGQAEPLPRSARRPAAETGDEEPLRVSQNKKRSSAGAKATGVLAAGRRPPVEEPTGDDIVIDGPGEREPRPIPEDILPTPRTSSTDDGSEGSGVQPARLTSAAAAKRPTTAATRTRRAPAKPAADVEPAEPASKPAADPDDVVEPDTSASKPTWRKLSQIQPPVPLDESVRRTSADNSSNGRVVLALHQPGETATRSLAAASGGALTGARAVPELVSHPAPTKPLCQVDPSTKKVLDLVLPGLDGKLVSIQDIDADLILLDFWGSWCKPCRTSIPHWIELQQRFGGKRLQVIGIACERPNDPRERQAAAAKAAKEYGINYQVLLSSMDGQCPAQKALQVQFYPTMVLLDRNGKILSREQGATDATLSRTDRAIFTALRDASNTDYE